MSDTATIAKPKQKPKAAETAPTTVHALEAAPLIVIVRNPNSIPLRPLSMSPDAIAMRASRDARKKKKLTRAYRNFRVKESLEAKVITYLETRRPGFRDRKLTDAELDAVLMQAYADLIEAGLAARLKP